MRNPGDQATGAGGGSEPPRPGEGVDGKARDRRGDFLVGGLGMFMQMGAGLIMLPITAVYLSPGELTFWSVFLTIQVLNALLEFGFSPAFARNFTYVFAGARSLSREGVPDKASDVCDLQVLTNLLGAARRFYGILGAISFTLLATAGTAYLYLLSDHLPDVEQVWSSWAVLVAAHAASTYFNWQTALLIGADRMRQNYLVMIVSRLAQVVFSVVGLMLTQSLYVMALGFLVSILVFRAMTHFFVRDITRSTAAYTPDPAAAVEMTKVVAHNATKVGWVTLGGFLTNRFNVFCYSMFLTAQAAAEYAISLQALSAVMSVSLVGVYMLTPMLVNARVNNDKANLREILAFVNLFAFAVFLCGVLGLVVLGEPLLELIHSKTLLPEVLPLLLICLVCWLDTQVTIATQFIQTSNKVPYLKAMVATGISVAASVMIAAWLGADLWLLLSVQAGLVLAYNAWKWPMAAAREAGLNSSNFLPSAIAGARRILLRGARAQA